MSAERDALATLAREACARAHAPYSGIHVGAAIRSAAGATYTGTNVENAAYPLGNCAEASAIAAGVQAEGPQFRIAETAVWAFDRDGRAVAVSPCGGCRQRIREFASAATRIHACDASGVRRSFTCDELLPVSFGPEHLS